MPRASAVAADFVLPPGAIADRWWTSHAATPSPKTSAPPAGSRVRPRPGVAARAHPIDFGHFKRASIERRILRRVLLGSYSDLSAYADALEKDDSAVETLYQDLLIGVTSFFREPERFEALKTVVFPALQHRGAQDTIRIWVAGCSTGEEVYSLAISLLEFLEGRPDAPRITIYGTDINEQSLRKARAALYSERDVSGVSPERLARFFAVAPGGYKIAKSLRELCVFAAHDVTRDPPYSRIDLLTCCNVLIYFDPELQKRAVALLQYALAPDGFLMLGSSENLRGATNQLTPVSTKPLIYRKRQMPGAPATFDVIPRALHASLAATPPAPLARRTRHDQDDCFLAAHLAPCGVLVNEQLEITRIRGEIARSSPWNREKRPSIFSTSFAIKRCWPSCGPRSAARFGSRPSSTGKTSSWWMATFAVAPASSDSVRGRTAGSRPLLDRVPRSPTPASASNRSLSATRSTACGTRWLPPSTIASNWPTRPRPRRQKRSRAMRNCAARTRSWRPPRKSCSRRTRS